MTTEMQILMPIAGASPFFDQKETYFPKPLIEVAGSTMIERAVAPWKAAVPDAHFLFLVQREDAVRFSLDATLRLIAGQDATVISLTAPTQGALCSCLLAVDALDMDGPLVICNGDQVIDANIAGILARFQQEAVDAGVVTFRSVHPRWSYVRLDDEGMVTQAAEKSVISSHAIAGIYYFRTAQTFVDAAMATIAADDHVNGSFFVAPSLNQILLAGGRVSQFPIAADVYHSFYSPQKIKDFVDQQLSVAVRGQGLAKRLRTTVIVPAAGQGSRFAEQGWKRPKPFIDVDGRPMIDHVLDNVSPAGSRSVVLIRQEHLDGQEKIISRLVAGGIHVSFVAALTEGTLCTAMLARKEFEAENPVLIANSDQLVDFSVTAFVQDALDRQLDGSILVFRDEERDPKWSFARISEDGLVQEVAEKKPISDLATVGIYFFRRGRDLVEAAVDMIVRNDRVNNEFYTCPVYNYMILNGAKIGVYEIPRSAMHGLGTPQDLRAYLTHIGAPDSQDGPDGDMA